MNQAPSSSISLSAVWLTFGAETLSVIFDCRWLIVLCAIIMLADMWWAYSEHMYHVKNCKTEEEKKKYEWRRSRAVRRTSMKFVDYLTLLLVGVVLGLSIFEPYGIATRVQTGAIGVLIGAACDLCSIWGHIAVVKGYKFNRDTVIRFFKKFLIAIVKRKSEDIGEALEDTIIKKEGEE
ncbi:MAG: hypothetical protein MJZ41_07505 [Bacteroidaceae bacterium]|nr:hypothetical protein [Bacteroidaceae bacterium]